jgi:hypothetical protein
MKWILFLILLMGCSSNELQLKQLELEQHKFDTFTRICEQALKMGKPRTNCNYNDQGRMVIGEPATP